jgi:hypothetical protein
MKMKIEIGDLPFIKVPNWTPIHKLENHTDTTLNPFFKLEPILYKLKTPHAKCSPHMPKCELKILPKCSPCLPKQKNTKKFGIGKTHTLENPHSKDLLTSKHSMTQKIAP